MRGKIKEKERKTKLKSVNKKMKNITREKES